MRLKTCYNVALVPDWRTSIFINMDFLVSFFSAQRALYVRRSYDHVEIIFMRLLAVPQWRISENVKKSLFQNDICYKPIRFRLVGLKQDGGLGKSRCSKNKNKTFGGIYWMM